MKYLLLAILIIAACAPDPEADARPRPLLGNAMPIQIVYYVGRDAAYPEAITRASVLVSEVGVTPAVIQETDEINPACPNTLNDFWSRKNYYCNRDGARPYWKRNVTTVILAPALEGGYFAGMASGTCRPNGGYVVINSKPEARKMTVALAHELGHLLGSGHDTGGATNGVKDPPNIMLADAGRYWEEDLHFSARSKTWIAQCLARLQRRTERRRRLRW